MVLLLCIFERIDGLAKDCRLKNKNKNEKTHRISVDRKSILGRFSFRKNS